MKTAVCNRRHPGHRCCPRWSGHQLECFGRHNGVLDYGRSRRKQGHGASSLQTNATAKTAMTGTNIPEGHRRAFEALTPGATTTSPATRRGSSPPRVFTTCATPTPPTRS